MSPAAITRPPSTDCITSDTAGDVGPADACTVLDMPAFKEEALGLWLFAYIGLLDTICANTPPAVQRRAVDEAEVVFIGLGGRVTLGLRVETDATGAATDFGVSSLSATPRLPGLSHLRFDLDETDNPLIALTHSLLLVVDLKRAPILAALNGASAPST